MYHWLQHHHFIQEHTTHSCVHFQQQKPGLTQQLQSICNYRLPFLDYVCFTRQLPNSHYKWQWSGQQEQKSITISGCSCTVLDWRRNLLSFSQPLLLELRWPTNILTWQDATLHRIVGYPLMGGGGGGEWREKHDIFKDVVALTFEMCSVELHPLCKRQHQKGLAELRSCVKVEVDVLGSSR